MGELADTSIWAATCDLKAQVLKDSTGRRPGALVLESDGFTYRSGSGRSISARWQDCGEFRTAWTPLPPGRSVVWPAPGGTRPAGLLPRGAGGLPAADLALLLNRYRDRFAPGGGA